MYQKMGKWMVVIGSVSNIKCEKVGQNKDISKLSFGVAVDRVDTGEKLDNGKPKMKTQYTNCVAWRDSADKYFKLLKDHEDVIVCGIMESRDYEGKTYKTLNVENIICNSSVSVAVENHEPVLDVSTQSVEFEVVEDGEVPF